jgi:hypothetical protein
MIPSIRRNEVDTVKTNELIHTCDTFALQLGDVLVLDNVRIHNGDDNEAIADWLWM